MASGNPFVASDVEGLREVTKGYGVLFPHGDDKALAEVIHKLCTDKVVFKRSVGIFPCVNPQVMEHHC